MRVKEANRHRVKQFCANCTRAVKLRHDHGRLACTAHLTVVAAGHAAECGEYEPAVDREAAVEAATMDGAGES